MKIWPVIELDSLSKDLDIFDRKAEPDPQLIEAGLYPPLPVAGSYLIHGFPLLQKAKELGIGQLFTVELPDMDKKDILALGLKCEARAGHYSWYEMERMVDYIQNEEKIDKGLVILIQGHDDPDFLNRLKKYRGFSSILKRLIADNILDFKTAQDVWKLPDTVFSSILLSKDKKRLTFSEKRIFLITLDEIIRRDSLEDSDIIKLCDELLSDKKPLEAIKRIRFPELSRLYERLNSIKDSVIKGAGIQLDAPPFFEGDFFQVQFSFQSKSQLEKRIKILERLKERTDELFRLL